jgi:hypothetical protein
MATFAPSAAKSFAVASPMPLLPPVISANFPASLGMSFSTVQNQRFKIESAKRVRPPALRSYKPELPIWVSDSRIVRLSCIGHNEFATRAVPAKSQGPDG